jgi:hypothetical protein
MHVLHCQKHADQVGLLFCTHLPSPFPIRFLQVDRLAAAALPKRLCERLVDDDFSVRLHSLGALRNYILSGIPSAVASVAESNVVPSILRCAADAMAAPAWAVLQLDTLSESLLCLLQLIETIPEQGAIVVSLGAEGLLRLLQRPAACPEAQYDSLLVLSLRVIRCLAELCPAFCSSLRETASLRTLIGSKAASPACSPLARLHAVGILATCFLRPGVEDTADVAGSSSVSRTITLSAVTKVAHAVSALAQTVLAGWDPLGEAHAVAAAFEAARVAAHAESRAVSAAREVIGARVRQASGSAVVPRSPATPAAAPSVPLDTPTRDGSDVDKPAAASEDEHEYRSVVADSVSDRDVASLPEIIEKQRAVAAAAAMRAGYASSRTSWFSSAQLAVLCAELIADICAAADVGDDVATDAEMSDDDECVVSAEAATSGCATDALPSDPHAQLDRRQHDAACMQAVISAGLPQLVLVALDRNLQALSSPGSSCDASFASMPRRFRSSCSFALCAVSERCAAALGNFFSSYAASQIARSSHVASLWTSLAAAVKFALSMGVAGAGAAPVSLAWLAEVKHSPHALAAAGRDGAVPLPEAIAACDAFDAEIDEEPTPSIPLNDRSAFAASLSVDAARVLSSPSGASAVFGAPTPSPAEVLSGLREVDTYGDGWVVSAALAAVAADCEIVEGSPSQEVIAGALLSSSDALLGHVRLAVVPQLLVAMKGVVSLAGRTDPDAKPSVEAPGVVLPLQSAELELIRSLAVGDAVLCAGVSAPSPALQAFSQLPSIVSLLHEARVHAIALLGALASTVTDRTSDGAAQFIVDDATHSVIGQVLAAAMSQSVRDGASRGGLLLRVAAADALVDAYSEDCAAHDDFFLSSGLLELCIAAADALGTDVRTAASLKSLDREDIPHARDVISNLRQFVEYKRAHKR